MEPQELSQKLTEERQKMLESDERVRKMILSSKERYKVVTIGETEVRIRPTIPRDVRRQIEKITKSDSSVEDSEVLMYELISRMCLDDPFDKADTWEFVDNETGECMSFLADIYKAALDTEANIKSFRRE
jgi:hypothetical protein